MKLRKLGILVAVAAVLAVMTIGNVSATVIFSGALDTTIYSNGGIYPNGYSVTKSYDAYGNRDVDVSDTAQFYSNFHNRVDRDLIGVNQISTTPGGSYSYTKIAYGITYGQDQNDILTSGTILEDGSHTISAYHIMVNLGPNGPG